jgi:DHA2 family multidrug resistance protein-like MFS transporter
MSTEETPARAGRREWIGLAVLALACLVYAMDLTVLHLAVPKLSADLEPSSAQLLWIVDIYGFLVAGLLITMGTLGDRIGRRKLLMLGAALFGMASVVAALSNSAEMLIASRALLGVAGATLAPSTLSLIRSMFHDPQQRTMAIGIWITAFSAGGAIGPLLGGVMLEFFWWGSVFLLAVPVMALLLAIGPRFLPEYRDPEPGRLDLLSAALSLVAILAVIYGIKQIAQDGVGWLPALSIVLGLAVGAAFARRQTRLADPLIDLRLFRLPAFSASLATYALVTVAIFGGFLFIYQYLQLVHGLSPLEAGVWMLPSSAGFVVGSMLTPQLARRFQPASVMGAGMAVGGVGFALLTQVDESSALALLVTSAVIFALGLAPVFTLATDLIVGAAPPERAGAAAAISETGSELGGALGIAILGSIGTAIYRDRVADAVPAGVPPDVADAARDTLGGAVAASEQLPGPLAADLLGTAREAFVEGLQLAATVSVAVIVVAAVIAVTLLRRVGASPEPEAVTGARAASSGCCGEGIEMVLAPSVTLPQAEPS